jgi:7,8-dihydropterin-6-yl-methyl-4-(beta-D-ribofuranosyl)aminobenzene 5'-phosphate synthase
MIYNNTGSNPDFKKEWGLSMWIEHKNQAILFDTGGNADTLWKNMETAGLDLSKLTMILISHNHWDHIRGIPMVLEKTAYKTPVYVPATDSAEFMNKNSKAIIRPVTRAQQITAYMWTGGELKGMLGGNVIFEQSIIIIQNNLVYLFTGCAHPGIIAIVERTKELHPDKDIALVAGGFHLIDKPAEQIQEVSVKLSELNVRRIAPSHCTGDKAIEFLRNEWTDRF